MENGNLEVEEENPGLIVFEVIMTNVKGVEVIVSVMVQVVLRERVTSTRS